MSRENSNTTLADGPHHDARGAEAKQVLLWKGWVLQQKLNDVQSRVGATATQVHVESSLRTDIFVDPCSVRHQGSCCASTREIPATWICMRTQGTERCSCDKTAALTRHKHTWISLRAQKKACSGKKIVALSRREHTWIALRAQATRQDCCTLTPRAHLDLSPCANGHVHATDCCVRTKRCMSTVLLKTRWVLKQRLN